MLIGVLKFIDGKISDLIDDRKSNLPGNGILEFNNM